jgi:hypothetical protein
MEQLLRQCIWVGFVVATLVARPSTPAASSELPERLVLEVDEACDGGNVDELTDALGARLQEVEVVERLVSERGRSEQTEAVLRWRAAEGDGCELAFVAGSSAETSPPTVDLASDADSSAIRNAASRIAWVMSTREPRSGETESASLDTPSDEKTPGEESDGATGESEAPGDQQSGEVDASSESEGDDSGSSDEASEQSEKQDSDEQEGANEERQEQGDDESSGAEVFGTGDAVPVRGTVVPLVSFPKPEPDRPVPSYAFNFVGYNYGLVGLEFGVLANIERAYVEGVQVGMVGNWVSGPVRGIQAGGFANVALGKVKGVSVAAAGTVTGGVEGGALSLFGGNLALGSVDGVQATLGVNWATGDVRGGQLATLNVARDVGGVQAGALNIGREVDGLQVGALNIAKRSDVSVGLLNINWARPLYVSSWMNELGVVSVGLQHGSRYFHNIFRVGYQPFSTPNLGVAGFGFGGHFPLGEGPMYLDVDGLFNVVAWQGPVRTRAAPWGQIRLTAGVELMPRLALYGGGSFNVSGSYGEGTIRPSGSLPSLGESGGPYVWPGFFAGLRL